MTGGFRTIRDGVTALAILAFLWLIAAKLNDRAEIVQAGSFHAADGDSLALGGERMRLYGIDAPELSQTCERAGTTWQCGVDAKRALQGLVAAKDTQCSGTERDRFQRLLVVCRAGSVDLNGAMVRKGLAVSYGAYHSEEAQARAEKIGLWAGTFEMPRSVRDHAREASGSRDTRLFGW
ncbi:exopolysaccharide biosynthesis protein [Rhizobium sp. AC44/96]|uniref:thermonuclease family protein n=1 Tax=Rhizobium sp. AC44/96 TaxID=1841654 RepID=UPI00081008C2|nr:thermonuclease family protein [Rhizobium sp. AC44/96]OCJ04330.1 exopolysaccharide biosynthesis protein [Rhizobium sp. AC44/96]